MSEDPVLFEAEARMRRAALLDLARAGAPPQPAAPQPPRLRLAAENGRPVELQPPASPREK